MAEYIETQLEESRKMSMDAECVSVTNKSDIAVLKYLRVCHKCHKSNLAVFSSSRSSEQFIRRHKNLVTDPKVSIEDIIKLSDELEKQPMDPITHIKFMCSNCDKIYSIVKSDYDSVYIDDLPKK